MHLCAQNFWFRGVLRSRSYSIRLLACTLAFAFIGTATATAQEYPVRAIKIVVASPPGGGTDILGRLIAERLVAKWGQPAFVENRGGNAGNIGAEAVSKSAPDGYTILLVAQGALVINKNLYKKLSYDPESFVPVSLVAVTPAVLILNPKMPAQNLGELIAYAKINPNKLNYATQGVGTSAHLTAELFNSMAGVRTVHVPYRGTSPMLVDLISGEVSMTFGELATAGPYVRAGKLKVIAIASETRSALAPELPTLAEVLPGFTSITWWGMVAPAGTPVSIAAKLSAAVTEALKHPEVARRLSELSIEGIGGTPQDLVNFMRQERTLWGKVIRDTGASAD